MKIRSLVNSASRHGAFALTLLASSILAGCGGGGGSSAVVAPSSLSGSVAVGAPLSGGKLRILDATGTEVYRGDIDADGRYNVPTLTGTAPYRIEACGQAGPNYQCIYSVAQGAGTSNVTPLTTATVLLASGKSPGDLMTGGDPGLGDTAVNGAQGRLRSGLAGVLAAGGVASDFDFVKGALDAGSRTGYDKLLDSVGVTTGVDAQPFVQITPRLGSGNLYIEKDSPAVGSVTVDPGAATLNLSGLEALFKRMTAAIASADACSTGFANQLASSVRMNMGGGAMNGPTEVGAGMCYFFAGQGNADDNMWGSKLLSPTLGRCDLSGSAPVCRVSFVLQGPDGSVQAVGGKMGVTQESGVWKFLGDVDPIEINAFATAQRDHRIDDATATDTYSRAVSFDIPNVSGLECALVSQREPSQALTPVAYYKPYSSGAPRLSLWQVNMFSNQRSLNVNVGALRSSDDTWVTLPEGADGDTVVRNFFRGGRTVMVSLFGDAACSTPFLIAGKSEFEVDIEGVPPLWTALPDLPWPTLSAPAVLRNLTLAGGASGTYTAAWTYEHGPLGIDSGTVCSDRAQCGDGGSGRLSDKRIRAGSTSTTFSLQNSGSAVLADGYKMLALFGRNGEGLMMQSSFLSCPTTPAGEACH